MAQADPPSHTDDVPSSTVLPHTVNDAALADLLAQWLPAQRFFAGKQRPIEALAAHHLASIGPVSTVGAEIEIWLADVRYADGGRELYQVPLHFSAAEYETQSHARLGSLRGSADSYLNVYDAMAGKHLTQAFLRGIADESVDGPLRFSRTAAVTDVPLGSTSIMLNAEQSNTSVVFGDQAIMKLFRRLEVGLNPDIEIHEALSRGGGKHIARLLGYLTTDLGGLGALGLGLPDGADGGAGTDEADRGDGGYQSASLAMLQDFMTTATDGWVLAKASVRDLMAEADLHAQEAGGDFAAEAYRLGKATAEVHAELVAAFGTEQLDADRVRQRAEAMMQRLDDALVLVPQLADVADALSGFYDALAQSDEMTVQRVHGDLHLGQVLRTVNRWVVLDFEGEPAKSITERRQPDSVLRDVAGMMRSFDYAANHQAIDTATDSQQHYRAVEWSERNRDAFCAGYGSVGPDPREQTTLLQAFEADKAVYEAVYEARNRPAWLAVPLASLSRLASPSDAHHANTHRFVINQFDAPPGAQIPADREDSR